MDGLLKNPNNEYRHLTDRERDDLREKGENIWRGYIKNKIRQCDAVICLIGKDTHNATGVIYELEAAQSLGKKIVPVRIPRTFGGAPSIISNLKIKNWDSMEINNALSRKKKVTL